MTKTLTNTEQVMATILFLAKELGRPVRTGEIKNYLNIDPTTLNNSLNSLKASGTIWKAADRRSWIIGRSI